MLVSSVSISSELSKLKVFWKLLNLQLVSEVEAV